MYREICELGQEHDPLWEKETMTYFRRAYQEICAHGQELWQQKEMVSYFRRMYQEICVFGQERQLLQQ